MRRSNPRLKFVYAMFLFLSGIICLNAQIPEKLRSLIGTYTGSWTMYGLDAEGNTIEKMTWTDVIEVRDPVVKKGKAYVTTVDKMTFKGNIPPQEIKGKEGYYLNEDGTLGDYFVDMQGQEEIRVHEIVKDVWVYSTKVSPYEYSILGLSDVAFAQHVMIKIVTREEGIETHRISRVTTVHWKDSADKDRWTQFISLQGFHRKEK